MSKLVGKNEKKKTIVEGNRIKGRRGQSGSWIVPELDSFLERRRQERREGNPLNERIIFRPFPVHTKTCIGIGGTMIVEGRCFPTFNNARGRSRDRSQSRGQSFVFHVAPGGGLASMLAEWDGSREERSRFNFQQGTKRVSRDVGGKNRRDPGRKGWRKVFPIFRNQRECRESLRSIRLRLLKHRSLNFDRTNRNPFRNSARFAYRGDDWFIIPVNCSTGVYIGEKGKLFHVKWGNKNGEET